MSGEEATTHIKGVNQQLNVHIVPDGSMVTADYRLDRVRIYVDENGKVVGVPKIG